MFEDLVSYFQANPYLGVAMVFVLCGVGLPLPEEIALVAAGYLCFLALDPASGINAELLTMCGVCAAAILAGDLIPFFLGKTFGPRLLRLRFLRFIVTKDRLATFDRWFRRRGDMVIFFARFVPGLRVVAFFTAGIMQMRWFRFLALDGAGILIVAPIFVFVGLHFGDVIDTALQRIGQIERGVMTILIGGGAVATLWWWLRRRKRQRMLLRGPQEAFVEQTVHKVEGESTPNAAPKAAGKTGTDSTDAEGQVLPGPGSKPDEPGQQT